MKKRIISITLLLSLLLSACGSGTGETSADTTSGEPELSSDEAQTGEYKKPSVDYKGAEFTVIDRKMENPMWIASGYSNIEAEEENGEPINDAQYKRNRQVEEELNIKLVQYSTEAAECANELRKLVLAGEDAVDAAMVRGNTMFTLLGEENLLTSFNDIPTMDTEASWWDQNASETFTFGGELMAITGDLSLFTSFAPVLMFINKEVAESHGIGDCYELVREGKWTWDKVMEMCELAAHDLNGDSKMDENDAYGMALQTGLLADSLISCGGRFTNSTPGGIELVLNNERTAAVVEKIVPFLNNDKVNSVANRYTGTYKNPYYMMHLPMFKNNQILFNFNQILVALDLRAMEADYGVLPLPKFDEAQENYYTSMSYTWVSLLCIPSTNTRLDMTGHVLDALGYYSKQYVTAEFIETTVRNKSLRDEDSAEMLEIIMDNTVYDIAHVYNWGKIIDEFYKLGTKNNTNFASMWASIEDKVTSELKTSLEQLQ